MLLIDSLPDELDHLCITLIHENDKLPFEEVHSALLNYEIQKKDRKEHQESVEASVVRGNKNKIWEKKVR